jgi:hypothetical protein
MFFVLSTIHNIIIFNISIVSITNILTGGGGGGRGGGGLGLGFIASDPSHLPLLFPPLTIKSAFGP